MKKILIFICVSFLTCSVFAKKTQDGNFNLKKISKTELSKTFKAKGLDPVIQELYSISMQVGAKYSTYRKNKMGQRVTDQKGKTALIKIVEATDHITRAMDPGTLHYYGPAKLYKKFRVDMNLAIEKAKISNEGKATLRSTLPNSY